MAIELSEDDVATRHPWNFKKNGRADSDIESRALEAYYSALALESRQARFI